MPHIDGLRCVAVMAVLLFHFGVPGMGGGYVGVDIFFVISGYLISSIIIGELKATGTFDFAGFYARRVRRILPALIATLAAATALAWFLLTPGELVSYGRSLAAASLSVSNLQFWMESGYFDAASQTKPLLHIWSLSVEEQFYLVWPALLYFCYKAFGARGLFWGIVVAGLASFAANHVAVASQRVNTASDLFFLPHFRVFEFAIGAIGYYLMGRLPASRLLHDAFLVVGVALILYSIMALKEGDVFPYVNAIAPCVGTLLVIMSCHSRLARGLLANPLAIWIGKISYSLYLAHWPIVVFAGRYMTGTHWASKAAAMLVLSLLAAIALHYLVEVKFRHGGRSAVGTGRVLRTLGAAGTCFALGVVLFASNGMTWRYHYFSPGQFHRSELIADAAATSRLHQDVAMSEEPASVPFHPLGADEIGAGKGRRFERVMAGCSVSVLDDPLKCHLERPEQVLIFGNSHEPDAYNAFDELYRNDPRVNLISFGTVNDCQLTFGKRSFRSTTRELSCADRFAVLGSDQFIKRLNVVVFNTHMGFDAIAADLWKILEIMKRRNPSLRIIAIGSYLQTSDECASLYNRTGTFNACRDPAFVNYINVDERSKSPIPQVHSLDYLYISKYALLCPGDIPSSCAIEADQEPAFYDQHHLSLAFSHLMGRRLGEAHGKELAALGLPLSSPDGTLP